MENHETKAVYGSSDSNTINNDIVAIITARGGSKGLPRKNIRMLKDKPLIAYSILAALNCPAISNCVVSTEDPEIKDVSMEWGADVIDRPLELATDEASSKDVVRHVLLTLQETNRLPSYFALLQPTSPLRAAFHLQECVEQFFKSDAQCAISVTEVEHHPYKSFLVDESKSIRPLFGVEYLDQPRQKLLPIYRQNGAIYIMSSKLFLEHHSFYVEPAMPYLMDNESSIDIDTWFDFQMVSVIMDQFNKDL